MYLDCRTVYPPSRDLRGDVGAGKADGGLDGRTGQKMRRYLKPVSNTPAGSVMSSRVTESAMGLGRGTAGVLLGNALHALCRLIVISISTCSYL